MFSMKAVHTVFHYEVIDLHFTTFLLSICFFKLLFNSNVQVIQVFKDAPITKANKPVDLIQKPDNIWLAAKYGAKQLYCSISR